MAVVSSRTGARIAPGYCLSRYVQASRSGVREGTL